MHNRILSTTKKKADMDTKLQNALTDTEILELTRGEVRKLVELILAIPEWEGTEPSADFLFAFAEDIEDRHRKVYDFIAPIVKSLDQREADPEFVPDGAAAAFLDDLKKGYDTGELDALQDRLEKIDLDPSSGMRTRKLLMIELSTLQYGIGIRKFINPLRKSIAQWISISDSVRHRDEQSPADDELSQAGNDAASGDAASGAGKTRLKKTSVKTLLSPIAALMTDYPVFWEDLTIRFELWGGEFVEGRSDFESIVVYPCTCVCNVFKEEKPPRRMCMIGKRIMRVLAHEFRHTQQQRLWDTDIPQVEWKIRRRKNAPGILLNKDLTEVYRNDPGETDARKFAEMVENTFDERFLSKIGRLALRYHKRHCREYCREIEVYFDNLEKRRG